MDMYSKYSKCNANTFFRWVCISRWVSFKMKKVGVKSISNHFNESNVSNVSCVRLFRYCLHPSLKCIDYFEIKWQLNQLSLMKWNTRCHELEISKKHTKKTIAYDWFHDWPSRKTFFNWIEMCVRRWTDKACLTTLFYSSISFSDCLIHERFSIKFDLENFVLFSLIKIIIFLAAIAIKPNKSDINRLLDSK